jgi:hypothetical protein
MGGNVDNASCDVSQEEALGQTPTQCLGGVHQKHLNARLVTHQESTSCWSGRSNKAENKTLSISLSTTGSSLLCAQHTTGCPYGTDMPGFLA